MEIEGFEFHFAPGVPKRYKQIIRDVVQRLPEAWDEHAEWGVESDPALAPKGYAKVLPLEEERGEFITPYVMTIFPSLLDRLSDAACRWVFAHEFAHIASKLPAGSIVIEGRPYTPLPGNSIYVEAASKNEHEDAADRIAMEWGFDTEMQSFLAEENALGGEPSE